MDEPGVLAKAGPDPRNQKMVDMLSKQILSALTDKDAARALAQHAKAEGAEVAILSALKEGATVGAQIAGESGIEIPDDVMQDALESVAKVLVGMMAKHGFVKDAEASLAAVLDYMENAPDDEASAPEGAMPEAMPPPEEEGMPPPQTMPPPGEDPRGILARRGGM